jgi:hypothetical protein
MRFTVVHCLLNIRFSSQAFLKLALRASSNMHDSTDHQSKGVVN